MTAREFREIMFYLSNQKMTVEELREMLYLIEDQDAELEPGFSMWLRAEKKYRESGR